MKRTLLCIVCLVAMMMAGTGLKAQQTTITLNPGWNWISYPEAVAMEIEMALGSFVPAEGDIVKSQFGFSVYQEGQWQGSFTHFMPGMGYMYCSSRSEVTSFFFANASSSVVATATPAEITATSAVVGGMVTIGDGNHVFARGVCWDTEPNPNIDGSHTVGETISGSQTALLDGLTPNTTYYVRAYAVTDYGLAYGNVLSFTTETGGGGGDHAYVDLGLPSGLLWATCNVGADNPEDYGDYFAWGETTTKDTYNWSTYQYCMGSENTLTKYCSNSSYGYNGFTDTLTTLLPGDDAATANWGGDWRMPTQAEFQELLDNTTVTWTTQNGVNGRLFTASNGNSLFLPAAGGRSNSSLYWAGRDGGYWSSSLITGFPYCAWEFGFQSDSGDLSYYSRCYGMSVRAVFPASQNTSYVIDVTANPAVGGTLAGGGTYEQGQSCTVTATANAGYTFTNWMENGTVVSTDATYTFTVNANRTLVANFAGYGLPYYQSFASSFGTYTIYNVVGAQSWGIDYSVAKMTGYSGGSYYANEDWLISSPVAITGVNDAKMTMVYIGRYFNNINDEVTIWASTNYTYGIAPSMASWTQVSATLTEGSNWSDFLTTEISLTQFVGQTVTIAVKYVSANNRAGTIEIQSITIEGSGGDGPNPPTPGGNDHAYVDLGLPSGLLWATCNVGADNPEDYGDYFAWGETQPKDTYNWSTYQYCNGSNGTLTKYCDDPSSGYNGFTDNLTTLLLEDDAASANWGSYWRMPTDAEWQELYNNTTNTWTTQNGVNGRLFTASNGNSLFLPAAGYRYNSSFDTAGSCGYYWSSSISGLPDDAWRFHFGTDYCFWGDYCRLYGYSVRPVCSAQN